MYFLFLCVILLSTGIDVAKCEYTYRPEVGGWIKVHKVVATWDEAYLTCQNEGHAVLASPLTTELTKELKAIISVNGHSIPYFIGTSSSFYPGGKFVSIEGVPIEDMPVSDMITQLDPQLGACLCMNGGEILVTSCSLRLPFVCYKKQFEDKQLNECGTRDNEYKLEPSTHRCYKVHIVEKNWDDAYSVCVEEGGYLVVLNDAVEAKVVTDITNKALVWEYITIGTRDKAGNGTWMTVHGEYLEDLYNVWEEGKAPATRAYKCGRLQNTGKLSYGICDFDRPFICEKDPYKTLFYSSSNEQSHSVPTEAETPSQMFALVRTRELVKK